MAAAGFNSMSSKSQSMAEMPSVEAEKSSGGINRRCSYDMQLDHSDGSSLEGVAEHVRGKSAEPEFIRETTISGDVQTDIDSLSRSMGTYLVVPGQGPMLKTTPDDKKIPSFVYSHNGKELRLDQVPPSTLLSHDSSLDAVQTIAASDQPNYSTFQVLESVLQQSSSPGVRDGFITPQTTSLDRTADSDCSSGAEAAQQQCASSNDSLDSATNEHLFRVREEHVAQQRMVSVEREQCITKEKAEMSVVKGRNASSRHHRAVTVSRSQTWSFRDKTKSDQLLKEAETVSTQDDTLGGSNEQLLDETFSRDLGVTVNRSTSANQSKTLPLTKQSSKATTPLRHGLEGQPFSSSTQSCLLKDYNKDKGWSFVPWTDEPRNQ